MLPHPELLDDFHPLVSQGVFAATLRGRGLYSTLQFVLRLSPLVHRKLASLPSGVVTTRSLDLEGVEAFSTYLHETVHWWQHIGSTYGLMLSMTHPAQAHANYDHLKNLTAQIGFRKSIRKVAEMSPAGGPGTPGGLANTIINNHFDMDAFRGLTVSPLSANTIVKNPLFESLGHSFHIAYGNIVSLLASVSDRDHKLIPNPQDWGDQYRLLRDSREEGYFYGSPISLYPIGAHEIFEGQARMVQLQYLHFASGGVLGIAEAEESGLFNGVYGTAFSTFLQLTQLDRPTSIDHPTIGLFLLICDLAINPGSGFPFPLIHFKTFITDIDPGARFVSFCVMARREHPALLGSIVNYSREEYASVSEALCKTMLERSPLAIAEEFNRWATAPEFDSLMREYNAFSFEKGNLAVRILLSHFLAFMRDKYLRPEFFCWPGVYMAGEKLASDAEILFDRHGALFVDKENDDGIYPRLPAGRSEADVQTAFDDFYANNVTYDLTRQWIVEPGPFVFDYRWLSQKGTVEEIQSFAERTFEAVYGLKPSQVTVL